jgi:hypothetical protein
MNTLDEDAAKTQRMADAIMAAIQATGDAWNLPIIAGALGSVVGAVAMASGIPDAFLATLTTVARGVTSGELLD